MVLIKFDIPEPDRKILADALMMYRKEKKKEGASDFFLARISKLIRVLFRDK